MCLIASSPNTRCPPNEQRLGTRENWETGVFIERLVPRAPRRVNQMSLQGFICPTFCSNAHLSRCQFRKEKRKIKKVSPLLQHQLILLLPLLLEIGGKLVPNGEEGVETDLFLTSLWFYWEGHGQLREAEKREKRRSGHQRAWSLFTRTSAHVDAHCQRFTSCFLNTKQWCRRFYENMNEACPTSNACLPRPLCPTWTLVLHFRSFESTNTQARVWKKNACTLHRDPVVKCGGHLQWINRADRLGSLCLECAIGTHS